MTSTEEEQKAATKFVLSAMDGKQTALGRGASILGLAIDLQIQLTRKEKRLEELTEAVLGYVHCSGPLNNESAEYAHTRAFLLQILNPPAEENSNDH